MSRDPLTLEPVQLDSIANGKLWDEFHSVFKRVLSTLPKGDAEEGAEFWDPKKARTITIKIVVKPDEGGVTIGYGIDTTVPVRKRAAAGYGQLDGEGNLLQFAARQATLPELADEDDGEEKVRRIRPDR